MTICLINYSGTLVELDPLSQTALELLAGEMRVIVDRNAPSKAYSCLIQGVN